MAHIQIGIKFCGGCRDGYNRINAMTQVRQACSAVADFEAAVPGKRYDAILALSGCMVFCQDMHGLTGEHGIIKIMGPEHISPAIEAVFRLAGTSPQ